MSNAMARFFLFSGFYLFMIYFEQILLKLLLT